VPCQGALLSLVKIQAGKLSLQPEALGADQEATNGLMWTALGRSIWPYSEWAARRTRTFFSLARQNAAPCSTPRGERARRLVGALLAPTPPESHGAQSGATAPRDSAAGAQPRAGPPASAGGTSMASTHPLPRSSTVAHVLSAVGINGLRTMRLHRVLDQLLTITMRRPCWSPTWCGACSDRASRSVPTYVGKLRSVALLCPAYVAALAAGHHGCALACQAPF
jgi:hypothetical protein